MPETHIEELLPRLEKDLDRSLNESPIEPTDNRVRYKDLEMYSPGDVYDSAEGVVSERLVMPMLPGMLFKVTFEEGQERTWGKVALDTTRFMLVLSGGFYEKSNDEVFSPNEVYVLDAGYPFELTSTVMGGEMLIYIIPPRFSKVLFSERWPLSLLRDYIKK